MGREINHHGLDPTAIMAVEAYDEAVAPSFACPFRDTIVGLLA